MIWYQCTTGNRINAACSASSTPRKERARQCNLLTVPSSRFPRRHRPGPTESPLWTIAASLVDSGSRSTLLGRRPEVWVWILQVQLRPLGRRTAHCPEERPDYRMHRTPLLAPRSSPGRALSGGCRAGALKCAMGFRRTDKPTEADWGEAVRMLRECMVRLPHTPADPAEREAALQEPIDIAPEPVPVEPPEQD
jgi:hypothetical protein